MKNKLIVFLSVMLVALILSSSAGSVSTLPPDEKIIVDENNNFALDLYKELKALDGNIFFSPASIFSGLAITYDGARGETAAEIAKMMHLNLDSDKFHAAYRALLQVNKGSSNYELHEANSIWLQDNYPLRPDFRETVQNIYLTSLNNVDFVKASEKARSTINDWVGSETDQKILDLIPIGAITDETRMVIVNAIYFKGDWQAPFDLTATTKDDFHLTKSQTVHVDFMHQRSGYQILDNESFQLLEQPYKSKDLSMIIILPKEQKSLSELELSLTNDNMTKWLKEMKYRDVDLRLPKFKTTLGLKLSRVLQAMGMKQAFSKQTANFSGISDNSHIPHEEALYLFDVLHKADITVEEKGTEAAAASGFIFTPVGSIGSQNLPPPIIFRADHPFFFIIQDNRTGRFLFMGRITDPSK